ncbi:MAG TPA: ARMT1-like domain-containing protein [Candidatus Omnitrophota bacterium]|nr:ARMT1-like domain-containing protein [Candidatus Omnitrophota bacterium]
MKTYLECIPCFFRQALEASSLAGADDVTRKKIIDEVASELPAFPLEASPPEMGRIIHGIVKKHTGKSDPYLEIKRKSNVFALKLYDKFKEKAERSKDSLLAAVEMAIAGNVIDFGVKNSVNIEKELDRILREEGRAIKRESERLFEFDSFRKNLECCKDLLYLADNCGETVFDRILIEEMVKMGISVDYAVKGSPIINDALVEDAEFCGIDKVARVISSGSDAPGTVACRCSEEFLGKLKNSCMVISKGQGNFEALSSRPPREIFFLFMAKCPVVVKDIGCDLGDTLLLKRGKKI